MEYREDIMPDLGNNSRKNPFFVPDGYFDSFTARLQEKISATKHVAASEHRRWIIQPSYAYILSIGLLILVTFSVALILRSPDKENFTSETAMSKLADYSLDNIDESTLLESLPQVEIEAIQNETVTREELLKYIEDENIDLTKITDEL